MDMSEVGTTKLFVKNHIQLMTKKKAETKKPVATIQSKGGKAVVKKYGKDHMRKLVEKRWKNAKKST